MKLLDTITAAGDVLSGNVVATIESNIAPAITVYSPGAGSGGASLTKALGIHAGVVVRDSSGRVVARFGEPAKFSPAAALVLVLVLAALGYVVVRVIRAV